MKNLKSNESPRRRVSKILILCGVCLFSVSCAMTPEMRMRMHQGLMQMNQEKREARARKKNRQSCTTQNVVSVDGNYYNVTNRNLTCENE